LYLFWNVVVFAIPQVISYLKDLSYSAAKSGFGLGFWLWYTRAYPRVLKPGSMGRYGSVEEGIGRRIISSGVRRYE